MGCVIYGAGSLTTALSPDLTVLLIGWSFLEGLGPALIMPAIVALVAGNFAPDRRSAAYGLVAAAGAIAIALGPLIGGLATTALAGSIMITVLTSSFLANIADNPAIPPSVTEQATVHLEGGAPVMSDAQSNAPSA